MEAAERNRSCLTEEEILFFLEVIHRSYGYDFRSYAKESQRRHIQALLQKYRISSLREIINAMESKPLLIHEIVKALTTVTTELFRDPVFYLAFRKHVIPYLQTYSNFKIWHPGCATGEEVYSMAILLSEYGLEKKALLYGTDINSECIAKAKTGQTSPQVFRTGTANYYQALGKRSFQEYWTLEEDAVWLTPTLLKRLVFAEHNLVTDGSFGEMQVICCRNVLIYFDRKLQDKVLSLFYSSLGIRGFLCLGTRESTAGSAVERGFELVDRQARIYRKVVGELRL